MPNSILDDPHLRAAACDVIIRLHEHEQYGRDEARAAKVLAKRIPGHSQEAYAAALRFLGALLRETIAAVREAARPQNSQQTADYSDVDAAAVLAHLQRRFPGCEDQVLTAFVDWVIYWHYLR